MINGEFTREDLVVDTELDVENGAVTAYLETWFDVDAKFGLHIADEDNTWVNLYATYAPGTDSLTMEYVISRENSEECRPYTPTENEKSLILAMMEERCQMSYGSTLAELVRQQEEPSMTM